MPYTECSVHYLSCYRAYSHKLWLIASNNLQNKPQIIEFYDTYVFATTSDHAPSPHPTKKDGEPQTAHNIQWAATTIYY